MATKQRINDPIRELRTAEDCQAFKRMLERQVAQEGVSASEWQRIKEEAWRSLSDMPPDDLRVG